MRIADPQRAWCLRFARWMTEAQRTRFLAMTTPASPLDDAWFLDLTRRYEKATGDRCPAGAVGGR